MTKAGGPSEAVLTAQHARMLAALDHQSLSASYADIKAAATHIKSMLQKKPFAKTPTFTWASVEGTSWSLSKLKHESSRKTAIALWSSGVLQLEKEPTHVNRTAPSQPQHDSPSTSQSQHQNTPDLTATTPGPPPSRSHREEDSDYGDFPTLEEVAEITPPALEQTRQQFTQKRKGVELVGPAPKRMQSIKSFLVTKELIPRSVTTSTKAKSSAKTPALPKSTNTARIVLGSAAPLPTSRSAFTASPFQKPANTDELTKEQGRGRPGSRPTNRSYDDNEAPPHDGGEHDERSTSNSTPYVQNGVGYVSGSIIHLYIDNIEVRADKQTQTVSCSGLLYLHLGATSSGSIEYRSLRARMLRKSEGRALTSKGCQGTMLTLDEARRWASDLSISNKLKLLFEWIEDPAHIENILRNAHCHRCGVGMDLRDMNRHTTDYYKKHIVAHIGGSVQKGDLASARFCYEPSCGLAFPTKAEYDEHYSKKH